MRTTTGRKKKVTTASKNLTDWDNSIGDPRWRPKIPTPPARLADKIVPKVSRTKDYERQAGDPRRNMAFSAIWTGFKPKVATENIKIPASEYKKLA